MVRSHFATPGPIKNGSEKLSGGVHNAQTTHANLSESVSVSVPGSVNAPLYCLFIAKQGLELYG